MGEAKRRRAEFEAWYSSLTENEQSVFEASYAVFNDIILKYEMTGGCYLISFFLAEYLREHFDIAVEPIVGYVTDESDDLPISHAWIEHNGKIIDLTLFLTESQPRGAALILGRAVKNGEIGYRYFREMSDASRASLHELLRLRPDAKRMVEHKEKEHAAASAANTSPEARRAYLDGAPKNRNYEALRAYLE